MQGPSWLTSLRDLFCRRREPRLVGLRRRRSGLHRAESLEGRRVMAFDLVAAFAQSDTPFFVSGQTAQTLTEAPQQITLRFSSGAKIDGSTLGAITVARAGGDGVFGNASDVNLTPTSGVGIVTVDDFPNQNQVVLRFAENLPDDLYRITIGSGLKTEAGDTFRAPLSFDVRLDLGAQVVSVVPQPIARVNNALQQSLNTIDVYFNANDPLQLASAQNPRNYRLVETDPATGADVAVQIPQTVSYNAATGKATLTFAADLGDKLYRLQVGGSDDTNATIDTAVVVGTVFQQAPNTTPAYTTNSFLGDGAAGVNDVDLYKAALAASGMLTVRVTPVAGFTPVIRLFSASGAELATGGDTLTYTASAAGSFFVGISSTGNTAYDAVLGTGAANGTTRGGYRLEFLSNVAVPGSDDNSSFAKATGLGTLGLAGQAFNAAIDVKPTISTLAGPLLFPTPPGTVDEPGHREIPLPTETHEMPAASLQVAGAAAQVAYCFPYIYGKDAQGNDLINAITENQKQRAREIFELYSRATGIRFVETVASGLRIVTGDLRVLDPNIPVPNGPAGLGGPTMSIMNGSIDWGKSEYGGLWQGVAMHEIGHSLGLGHSYDIPSIMGAQGSTVLPGDHDLVHLSVLYPANSTDIDVYSFQLDQSGKLSAETVVARPGRAATSLLDSVLTLYREAEGSGRRELVARNDDYYGRDSFIGLDLDKADGAGKKYTYYLAVTSTGNTAFNPAVDDSGANGRSDGAYQLRLSFAPAGESSNTIVDATGTPLDGDRDGLAGGAFNFWFRSATASNTVYVDKLAASGGADGSLAKPFNTIAAGLAAAGNAGKTIMRIVGNASATPYLVGTNLLNQPLPDGTSFVIPRNVTVMIDAGAVLKFRSQVIDVGSSSPLVSRAGAALQVLGTPESRVQFTSYHDDSIGGNSDDVGPAASGGQWGGIIFRQDSDSATRRVFLNTVSNAVVRYGGGEVTIDGKPQSIAPLHLESSRPTLAFSDVRNSAGAAISADPNSFEESDGRAGPSIRGNVVRDNSINGLLVRIRTAFGKPLDRLSVPARFASPDITYVIPENLLIAGGVGGYETMVQRAGRVTAGSTAVTGLDSVAGLAVGMRVSAPGVPVGATIAAIDSATNTITLSSQATVSGSPVTLAFEPQTPVAMARASGRLRVDPGVIVKLQGARIDLERGNAQLYAEGTAQKRVIFTSTTDNRFGAGGTFVVTGTTGNIPAAGNWGGIVVNDAATASIDNAVISFGGGQTPVDGGFATTNTLLVDQGTLRLANSRVEKNASGIYVIGAQPVIVGNDFRSNGGDLISVDANSLNSREVSDPGQMTGPSGRFVRYDDNRGPLVRGNTVTAGGGISGIVVRGDQITVESIWDDTDIVHVLRDEIVVSNFHTATGLRLMSNPSGSLVVKLLGSSAGFTATGYGLDIDDRIGGSVQVIGQPGYPVILTSLADDSVGASLDPIGVTVTDTNGDGAASRPQAGEWRGLRFLPYSNDRNVAVYREAEQAVTGGVDMNLAVPQFLGVLAPNELGGDDNRRLGFEVHGAIAVDDSKDVDVYSFSGYAGSEVWIDLDNTSPGLDAMVELLDVSGAVIARSADGQTDGNLTAPTRGAGLSLQKNPALGADYFSRNPRDPGMRVVLPGLASDEPTQYLIRVRSQPKPAAGGSLADYEAQLRAADVRSGATSGSYELRIRLQQRDEKPGSIVRYADIRYPVVGVDVQGLPQRSPLVGTIGEGSRTVFEYPQFTNTSGLSLNGSAAVSSGHLVLTRSGGVNDASAVWSRGQYNVGGGFDSRFRFRISDLVNGGADGLAFVIQNLGVTERGEAGSGLGYRGIGSFLAIEFDTAASTDVAANDPAGNDNHIDIRLRAPLAIPTAGTSLARTAVGAIPDLSDGREHEVRVRYDGTQLSVFLDDMTTPRLTVTVNLDTALGLAQGLAYAGLTGATGAGASQRAEIASWSFQADQPAAAGNDTFATAQYVGNLLTSDQNTISVAGTVASATDIDWYVLDLNYEQIQAIAGVNNGLKTWSTVFDIDYADGFRGDLTLSVFDSQGRLLYVGRDSNVADDQPGVGQTNFEDVSRGSAGKLDPFIGPVQLPTGLPGSSVGEGGYNPPPDPIVGPSVTTRYYVAVSSNEQLPSVLDMTFKAGATNTLVRLEPVNSVRRVVEDRIGLQGYHSGEFVTGSDSDDYTYVAPSGGPLFPLATLETKVSPFTLDDVVYYLSRRAAPTGPSLGTLATADDLAMRTDGHLYAYTGVTQAANTAGTLNWINIRTNQVTAVGNDKIPDYPAVSVPTKVTDPVATLTSAAVFATSSPFQVDAHPAATSTVDVGTVSGTLQYTVTLPGNPLPSTGTWTFTSNASGQLTFTPVFGVPAGMPVPADTLSTVNSAGVVTVIWRDTGTGANVLLSGLSMTSVTYFYIPNPPDPEMVTTDAVDALAWGRSLGGGTNFTQLYYAVRDVDFLTRLETGVSRLYRANPATGDATNVDIYGRIGGLIQTVDNKLGLTTGMSFVDGTLYGVDTNGYLFTISLETAQATIVKGLGIPNLQALANGPQNVAGGPSNTIGYFNDKLFALDGDGWLYAIDRDGNQLDVFENNTMSKAYFGPRDPVTREPLPGGTFTGFAFSPIDIPLWRGTNNRGGEAGHGVTPALDRTRDGLFDDDGKKSPEQIGHTSIYYGFDATSGFAPDRTTVVNHLYLNPAVTTWASHLASGIGTSVADLPVKGSGQVTVAGFTTINSRDVTVAQTGRLRAGMSVTGPGIQPNTLISEILGNVVRLSRVATVTTPPETTVDLTFTGEGIAIRTNSFSLADHDYTDKPTLYFNYRIESGAGSTKVQASIDGGGEWITIASNASGRSPIDTALNDLPAFPSVSSRIGGQPNQLVQELFQNTGWRQARIDLGIFAGAPDIQLRIIFNPITVAGNCEGIYLDDFVVGFAERGEMVTNAPANTAFFGIGTPVSATTPQQNLQGAYQLEIRRGKEYGGLSSSTSGAVQIAGDPDQWPYNVITTNDSLVRGTAHSGAGAAGVTPEQNLRGDDNNPRGQGQFIIEGNVITHADQFGIRIDAAARDAATGTSTSGVVKNTPVTNSSRLVPGVVVANNVIASTHREAGLLFSGDSQTNLPAPVPYGRIVNNTIYGGASVTLPGTFQAASAVVTVPSTAKLWAGMMVTGTGIPADTRIQSIDSATQVRLTRAATAAGTGVQLLFAFRTVGVQVTDNAAPTLLNNVFASLATGIEVDGTSTGTVVGFSAFYETAAGVTGSDARVIPSNPFVDAARGNFYPKAGSPIIDAAIDVLQDRPSYRAVTQPLGIPASPIIVPRTDLFGQLRSDDPTQASPTGLGSNVFKDLGAIDRVDFVQPSATLAVPLDGATGSIVDQDPDNNQVRLVKADARGIAKFELQLNDVGVGVDKTTVVKQAFAITRGGTTLTEGTDYVFRFLESTNRVVFEAAAIYPMGSYVISVVQAPVNGVPTNVITDLAGNPLLPNNGDGTTSFAIDLADVPTPPTGLVGLTGDQQVQLSWTAAVSDGSPLTRYEVQQAENASFTGATTTNVLPPAVSLTATPLVNGTPYWFRVRAVNAVGDSEWSNVTGPVVPLPIPTFALAQDTGASSSDGVTSNRTVNVSGVLGGASWEYSVDGGTIWSAGTGSSFQLPANATYAVGNVRIRQVVGESLSGSFSNATAITVDTNAPAAPTVALGTGVADTANLAEATQVSGVVRVTGELGSTITVTFTRGANIVTKTVTGTGVSQPIVLTTTDVQTTLGDGTITVSATQTDLAGNGSAPASTTSFLLATTPASAPTSVAGTPGNQQVALTWVVPTSDGGSAITDYVVQYRVNALGSQWTTFADGGSTALAATVTGLTNGTAYVFRVAAVTGAGDGAYSVESAPVTPRTVPGVPTGLTGVMGDSAVTLNWSAPSSNGGALITDYVVQYRVNALGSQWTTFADGTSAVSSATVTGLTNGTAYVFRVAAVNVAGAGGYSAESAAVTPLAPALAPTSLAGTAGNQQVALSWGVPASDGGSVITDYVIQYRVQGVGASWTTFADGTSSAVAATVTGLTNGTAYVFRVAAVTAVGVGAFSARSAAIVPVTAPAAPTAVAGVAGNSQVTLSWTAPASDGGVPIKDYQISYSSDGTNYTVFNDGLSAGTTATVTGLTNGTTYIFRVAAVNGSDLVGPAGESGSVRPFVLLAAPTALVAVGQNGRVSLSWVAPGPGVVDYRVEFRVSGVGAAWQTFADGTSTATQAVVTGLTNGTQYAFRVAAVSADGLGLYSGPVTATPVSVPVAAPTSVRGTRASSTITLQWNPPPVNPAAPTTRYVIQYRLNAAGSVWQTLAIQPTATSVVINGLTNRLGYFFRVAGANGAGVGPWSASSARI